MRQQSRHGGGLAPGWGTGMSPGPRDRPSCTPTR